MPQLPDYPAKLRHFAFDRYVYSVYDPPCSLDLMTQTFILSREQQVCDFCSDPRPVTAFQCPNFMWAKYSLIPQQSDGAWAACAVCAALISSEDWKSLTDRSFFAFTRLHKVPITDQPALRATLGELHRQFRENYRRPD